MWKKLSIILGIVIALGTITGFCMKVDSRYAKQVAMVKLEQRLDQKIKQDRLDGIQQRIWQLEDRYHNKEMPQSVKEECRKLKAEKERLEKQLSK